MYKFQKREMVIYWKKQTKSFKQKLLYKCKYLQYSQCLGKIEILSDQLWKLNI